MSVKVDADASRNACEGCAKWKPWNDTNKRYNVAGRHCTTCHADDHVACLHCGACLPARSRYDRRYCGSSCRAKATHQRDTERIARAAWEAEHPEEAAQQAREAMQRAENLRLIYAEMGPTEAVKAARRKRGEIIERADRCADCEQPFTAGHVIYRRPDNYTGEHHMRVVPVCSGCRCFTRPVIQPHCPGGRCERCRPQGGTWRWEIRRYITRWVCPDAGHGHVGPYCDQCHPLNWRKPRPCEGCGRPVANRRDIRRGLRRGAYVDHEDQDIAWVPNGNGGYTDIAAEDIVRTFCSEHCRREMFRGEQRAKRQAARDDSVRRCQCGAEFKPRRGDARYCSPACRQKAYRRRKAAS